MMGKAMWGDRAAEAVVDVRVLPELLDRVIMEDLLVVRVAVVAVEQEKLGVIVLGIMVEMVVTVA